MKAYRNPNKPRRIAISPMPLPRPRKPGLGPCPYAVQFDGGPWHGLSMKLRANSTILPIRVRGGIYQPSGKFFRVGGAA